MLGARVKCGLKVGLAGSRSARGFPFSSCQQASAGGLSGFGARIAGPPGTAVEKPARQKFVPPGRPDCRRRLRQTVGCLLWGGSERIRGAPCRTRPVCAGEVGNAQSFERVGFQSMPAVHFGLKPIQVERSGMAAAKFIPA